MDTPEGNNLLQEGPMYVAVSLGIFGIKNPVRRLCIALAESSWFDGLVLVVILANCTLLALQEPLRGPEEGRNRIIAISEPYFAIFYGTEMVIKVIALGLYVGDRDGQAQGLAAKSGPSASRQASAEAKKYSPYLRDGWNILDALVTIWGLLSCAFISCARLTSPSL